MAAGRYSPQVEGGSGPRVHSGTALGARRTALTLLQKSSGDIRHQCLGWSLSGFAGHVSAIQICRGTAKRCASMEKSKALQRSRLERPAAWRWTSLGTERDAQQTSGAQHATAPCTTTNLSPSSRFPVSLGFLTATSI